MKSLKDISEKFKDEWFRRGEPTVREQKVDYKKWALLTFLEKHTKPAKFNSVPEEVLSSLPDYEQNKLKDYFWRIDKDKNFYAFDGDINDIDYVNTPVSPIYYRGQYKPLLSFDGNGILTDIKANKTEKKIYNDIVNKDSKLRDTMKKANQELKAIQLEAMYKY